MTTEQTIAAGAPLTRWFELATCRRGSTDDFFDYPVRGGRPDQAAYRVACQYCARCPVLHSCRREADTRGEVGVWGGQLRTASGSSSRTFDLLPSASAGASRRRR